MYAKNYGWKQIDKLQTNHRGVFVLKDFKIKMAREISSGYGTFTYYGNTFISIYVWCYPWGALANLGIPSVVSCDFLADGQRMAACSFNIKVK